METTSHAQSRMRQRGIDARLVDLVLEVGVPLPNCPDRMLLTRDRLKMLLQRGLIGRELFDLAEKAVPLVCVARNDSLVTTFRVDRRINRRRRRRRRRDHNRHRR